MPEPRCPECGCTADQPTLCRDPWHNRMRAERNRAAFIAEGCCGMVAVHTADCPKFSWSDLRAAIHKYAPEPEPSVLLDLVRQYASQRYMHGLVEGGLLPDTQGHEAAADALFERIVALVPQHPVQARDGRGNLWWLHEFCRDAYAADDQENHERHCEPGPWRPLLVGGDPAPATTCGDCGCTNVLHKPKADPLVLSLPTVPDRATLATPGGLRWEPVGRRGLYACDQLETSRRLGELLDEYDSLTVVMREPRTWPKLDGPPKDLVRFKDASGRVWRRGDGGIALWCWADSAGTLHGFRTFAEIQHDDGPLTEVFDDEPGARS